MKSDLSLSLSEYSRGSLLLFSSKNKVLWVRAPREKVSIILHRKVALKFGDLRPPHFHPLSLFSAASKVAVYFDKNSRKMSVY